MAGKIKSISQKYLHVWLIDDCLTLQAPIPQNGQTHSNNSSTKAAKADELFECLWPFCGVGA